MSRSADRALRSSEDTRWRRQFRAAGFAQVPGLLPRAQRARLRDDALAARPGARVRRRHGFRLTPDGRVLGPTQRLGGAGRALRTVGCGKRLVSRLEAISGLALKPCRSTYLYYQHGDFLALHRDRPGSAITVLVFLAGRAGPLRVHPELVGVRDETLLELAERSDGHLPGGLDIELEQAPCVLAGHAIPHSRPPHPYHEDLVVAAFTYAERVRTTTGD
jgi:hypothetical protein